MVLKKKMIFNTFYFGGSCGGPERTDFLQFLQVGPT